MLGKQTNIKVFPIPRKATSEVLSDILCVPINVGICVLMRCKARKMIIKSSESHFFPKEFSSFLGHVRSAQHLKFLGRETEVETQRMVTEVTAWDEIWGKAAFSGSHEPFQHLFLARQKFLAFRVKQGLLTLSEC